MSFEVGSLYVKNRQFIHSHDKPIPLESWINHVDELRKRRIVLFDSSQFVKDSIILITSDNQYVKGYRKQRYQILFYGMSILMEIEGQYSYEQWSKFNV